MISKSWSFPVSAPGNFLALALFTPDWKRSSLECNQSGCGVAIWAMPGPSSGCFEMTKSVRQHQHNFVKGGKLQKSESSLSCVLIAEGSTNALHVSTKVINIC